MGGRWGKAGGGALLVVFRHLGRFLNHIKHVSSQQREVSEDAQTCAVAVH